MEHEAVLSLERMQEIKDRAKLLEDSNSKLRSKALLLREGFSALEDENATLKQEIEALEAQLAARQEKSNRAPKHRSEESLVFANRSGEKWPRKPPLPLKGFVGLKFEKGSAVDALKSILKQLFSSVVDAANFFSTSLQEIISAAEITRGIARLRIRNLETEHLLFDLDKRIVDGISIRSFVESFNWLQTPIIVTPQSMAASRARLPQVEAHIAEVLNQPENLAGYNAEDYMKQKERSSTLSQQSLGSRSVVGADSNATAGLELKRIGRALNVREKYLLSHNQIEDRNLPHWIAELSAEYYGEAEQQRKQEKSDAAGSPAPDESVIKAFSNASVNHSRDSSRRSSNITKLLTTELVSQDEHPAVRRIKLQHDKLINGPGRPVLSAVTADATWVKQDRTLAASAAKKPANAGHGYDLDGRLVPKPPGPGTSPWRDSADAQPDREGAAGASGKFKARLHHKRRNPLENASPANLAYVMMQRVSEEALAAYDRSADDRVFQRFVDDVARHHPRAGTVARHIAQRAEAGRTEEGEPESEHAEQEGDGHVDDHVGDHVGEDAIEEHHEEAEGEGEPAQPALVSREVSQEFDADDDGQKPPTPDIDEAPHGEVEEEAEVHGEMSAEPVLGEVSQEMVGGDVSGEEGGQDEAAFEE